MPLSRASATRSARPQVVGENVRDEAVFGVVGGRDRVVLGLERRQRRDRAEDLLRAHGGVPRYPGQHGRRVEVPAPPGDRSAGEHGGAMIDGVGDQRLDLEQRGLVDQRPDLDARSRCPGRPTATSSARRAGVRTRRSPAPARRSGSRPCRPRPCCASSPAIAPSTASSRSASSKTRNGALPPSSIDVRRTFSAHCSSSRRPTWVDPVNDSLRARPDRISGSITRPASVAVMHVDARRRAARPRSGCPSARASTAASAGPA